MKERIPDPNKMKRISGPNLTKNQLKTTKVRITTYLDEDVLDALRQLSETAGGKYQVLLNQLLRNVLLMEGGQTIFKRIEKLEKAVFRKQSS